jgi:acetyl esterase/lipase
MSFDDLIPQPPINPRADVYAATALALSRAVAERSRGVFDIPYGPHRQQRLDLYLPLAPGAHHVPVFINIHGGGWTHGYKEWMGFMAPPIVSLPAIYVALDYRLAPDHRYPAPLEDCLDALAWVHQNIARHGGDPDRIHVGGHSAGAQLAALMVLRRDRLAARGLAPDVIKSCFPYSGVYDFTEEHALKLAERFLARRGDADDASPIRHAAGNRTPFYVTWAEHDGPFALANSPPFVEALRREGARAESYVFEKFDHFTIHLDMQRPENRFVRTLRSWMAGDPATAPLG